MQSKIGMGYHERSIPQLLRAWPAVFRRDRAGVRHQSDPRHSRADRQKPSSSPHPHEDAIHAAGWISLFMLHLLWPFLWIWAMMYRPDRGWGFSHKPGEPATPREAVTELEDLRHRLAEGRSQTPRRSIKSTRKPSARQVRLGRTRRSISREGKRFYSRDNTRGKPRQRAIANSRYQIGGHRSRFCSP